MGRAMAHAAPPAWASDRDAYMQQQRQPYVGQQSITTATVVTEQHQHTASASDKHDDAINEADLILIDGCCCFNDTLYCKAPECVGCSGKGECICCVQQFCCKMGTDLLWCTSTNPDVMCQFGCACCSCGLKTPTTCLMVQQQVCCMVQNCAFPTTDEVPCTMALCFLACYPACGCCKTLGSLTEKTTTTIEQKVVVQTHHLNNRAPTHLPA